MLQSPRELLRTTTELYRREFWLFLGYAAWLLVPVATFYFASELPKNPVTAVLIIVTVILQLFVWLWISVCLMKATVLLLNRKSIDHNALSTAALRRIQPLLAVIFLQALIFIGGFLLLIIPALIFWTWYGLAQTATILDEKPVVESLSYSRSLVRGRFFPVLWRLISGPAMIGLLYAFLSGAILLTLSVLFNVDLAIVFSDSPPLWASLVQTIVDIFFVPLFIIYSVLLYQDLSSRPVEKASQVA